LEAHGKKAGHSKIITDTCYSGDLIITKDSGSMRLWRAAGDFALLRVVSCAGKHVAVHHSGQFIVTGNRRLAATIGDEGGRGEEDGGEGQSVASAGVSKALKVWGPAGGSAFAAGKKTMTTGIAK
jgi:hypothetical protein